MTYREAILAALDRSGRSARDVSLAAVGHESAIRSLKRGMDLRGTTIDALCRELDIEVRFEPRGDSAPLASNGRSSRTATARTNGAPPAWARDLDAGVQKGLSGLQKELRALTERLETPQAEHGLSMLTFVQEANSLEDDTATGNPAAAPAAYRPVAVAEMDAAAGGGAWDPDERVTRWVYFRREWLDRHAVQPKLCRVIGVRGESMGETLPDGCSILVDLGRRRRREGRIYVVRTDEGVVVKRAGKDDGGKWVLISDNLSWEDRPWDRDDVTIGEVRWMARTL